MTLRRLLHWKFVFHDLILPLLRWLPPKQADRGLRGIGRLLDLVQPWRRKRIRRAVERVRTAANTPWETATVCRRLAASIPRYLARDGLLDGLRDTEALKRFDIEGWDHYESATAAGRGVILVGSHFGAHLPALHALYRKGARLRLLVQRPRHVSKYLQSKFDEVDDRPQSRFFVRRGLTTGESAERILLARAALREGRTIYLNGDIPWSGSNTREATLLGRTRRFLSLWCDLAVLTQAPVILIFAKHLADGRFQVRFEPPLNLVAGGESAAFHRYFELLEMEILEHPEEAMPYLLWRSFNPETP